MRFLLLFLISTASYSQSIDFFVINSLGQSYETPDGQLTISVGEANVRYRLGLSELITDGFLQSRPNPSVVTANQDYVELNNTLFYPNPTSDILTVIDMDGSNYILSDMNGSTIMEGVIQNQINTSNLKAGIYILTITNNKITTTHKLVKQ